MGRGLSLWGRRSWIAEVRNGSTDMFFSPRYDIYTNGWHALARTAVASVSVILRHLWANNCVIVLISSDVINYQPRLKTRLTSADQSDDQLVFNCLFVSNKCASTSFLTQCWEICAMDIYAFCVLRCGRQSKMEEAIFTWRGCRCLKCPLKCSENVSSLFISATE